MITRVVNMKFEAFDVYIGRRGHGYDGYFGNPFRLVDEFQRAAVLAQYKEWFYKRIEVDQQFKRRVEDLRGKVLGCFCKPKMCHGDVIAEYLNKCTITSIAGSEKS